jgi:hypothetical protein
MPIRLQQRKQIHRAKRPLSIAIEVVPAQEREIRRPGKRIRRQPKKSRLKVKAEPRLQAAVVAMPRARPVDAALLRTIPSPAAPPKPTPLTPTPPTTTTTPTPPITTPTLP